MQSPKKRYYPDCYICGNKLEKKYEILPGLVHCPFCKHEHHVNQNYDQDILQRLSDADRLRNTLQFEEAMKRYQAIIDDDKLSFEGYLGLFLTTYGITYNRDQVTKKYIPTINREVDEQPSSNKYMMRMIEITSDPYKKKYFNKEREKYDQLWMDSRLIDDKKKYLKASVPVMEQPIKNVLPIIDVVETKPIGAKVAPNYQIDRNIENKIKNAELIYLKTNKFSRAEKIFDEALAADPLAKEAIWGKILCKLQVMDFDLLTPSTSIKPIFSLFEKLMACMTEKEENPYLDALEKHFYKMLNQASIFDTELFDYILSWKKEPTQRLIAKNLYILIRKNLEKELHDSIGWIHPALAATSRFLLDIDQAGYIHQYIDTMKRLIELKFYKDVLQMADVVLLVNPHNKEALLMQICAMYKVQHLSELHHIIRDLKFMPMFEKLLIGDYDILELFNEMRLAILEIIQDKNFKFALQLIDIYIDKIPSKDIEILNGALQEFSDHLIYHERFKVAEKYINMLLSNNSKLPAAHWSKLKIALRAQTNFDVLISHRKDLMLYPDYENAINSVEHPEEYVRFYEIHDHIHKMSMESGKLKRVMKSNFGYFNRQCSTEDVETFVSVIYPKMEEDIPLIVGEGKAAVFNMLIRSLIAFCIIAFGFVFGNVELLFDPLKTADSLIIAANMFEILKWIFLYGVLPVFLFLFIMNSPRFDEPYIKGLLKGVFYGLISSAVFALIVGVIPWAAVRFLQDFVLNISTVALPVGLLGFGGFGIIYVSFKFHHDLKDSVLFNKFKPISIINIILLFIIWGAAITFSILNYSKLIEL